MTAFALALVGWLLVTSALSKMPATLPWCASVALVAVAIGQRFLPAAQSKHRDYRFDVET